MKRIFTTFRFGLVSVLFLCFFGQILWGQMIFREAVNYELVESITPQFKKKEATIPFKLDTEMTTLIEYSQKAVDPFVRSVATDNFLDKYYTNYQRFLLKNGDIAYLKFYYKKYLTYLKACEVLAKHQNVPFDVNRASFFKQSTLATRKEKRAYWRQFDKTRKELILQFFKFRSYILPAISTEIAMILQKEHLPELATSMNQLKNLDDSPLPVYVYSNQHLMIPKNQTNFKKIAGISIISKCDNIFTSGSPAVRSSFPGLRGNNKGLSVHLRLFEDGITLSHELGHLYYLYHKWEDYIAYIQEKGKDYELGGHGADDPSGHAAGLTERGIMPF